MMMALVFAGMTALAVLAVLVPLARRRAVPQGSETAVYRDQLFEIGRDRDSGALGPAEAEAARVEVARRLLAASENPEPQGAPSLFRRRTVALVALLVLPVAAFLLYMLLGRPDLPDQPLAVREQPARPVSMAELVAALEQSMEPSQRERYQQARAAEASGNGSEAAAIYRELLQEAPKNAPWRNLVGAALAAVALGQEGMAPAVDPEALGNVSAADRAATIRGMVEGLEARLKGEPRDLGGQLRLIRAWVMLNEPDRARQAAQAAQAAFAEDAAARQRIGDLVLGLGLEDMVP